MQGRNSGQCCYLRGMTQDEESIGQINMYVYIQKALILHSIYISTGILVQSCYFYILRKNLKEW